MRTVVVRVLGRTVVEACWTTSVLAVEPVEMDDPNECPLCDATGWVEGSVVTEREPTD